VFMKKWEYKFVELNPPSNLIASEKEFKQLGKEGWELIATYSVTEKGSTTNLAILKKEIE
jgi:hypothetical protein